MGQGGGQFAKGGEFLGCGQPGLRFEELNGFLMEPGIGGLQSLGQLPVAFTQPGLPPGDHPDQQTGRQIENDLHQLAHGLRAVPDIEENMGDEGNGGEQGQTQAAAHAEPETAQHNGKITEPPVGVVIEVQIAGGEKMEQPDGYNGGEQGRKKKFRGC
ncbi:MAG: hypothetical protein CVU68_11900 [Deltaproteobacteria bacterium HGW-Deltaproteobacteria-3]|nr:MAG: hypothetical protein CVU68_11900 [Deltaproteobacteria bacterium HGW-Deltaproteobacteria-3]